MNSSLILLLAGDDTNKDITKGNSLENLWPICFPRNYQRYCVTGCFHRKGPTNFPASQKSWSNSIQCTPTDSLFSFAVWNVTIQLAKNKIWLPSSNGDELDTISSLVMSLNWSPQLQLSSDLRFWLPEVSYECQEQREGCFSSEPLHQICSFPHLWWASCFSPISLPHLPNSRWNRWPERVGRWAGRLCCLVGSSKEMVRSGLGLQRLWHLG